MLDRRRVAPFLRRDSTPRYVPLRWQPYQAKERRQLDELLRRAPVAHVHVAAYLLETEQNGWGPHLWTLHEPAGRVVGALQRLRGISWAVDAAYTDAPAGIAALSEFVGRWALSQEFVFGPEEMVLRVVEEARATGLTPLEIRRQVMMRCDQPTIPARLDDGFSLRQATPADLSWLLSAHGAMCREDLGIDQVARNPEGYRRHFQELIRRGLCFVGEIADRPVFKAEAPVVSDRAWLFEGVFTDPSMRGRGIASRAMADLTSQATGRGFISCLYVHRRNPAALRVYGRIGYREVSPWTTVMASREAPGPGGPLLW